MDASLRAFIRLRAGDRCEYCQLHQDNELFFPFQTEHIIARQHGGPDTASNIAWACHRCNLHKGPNISGIDPVKRKVVRLFHPRRHKWSFHFRWDGAALVGRTPVGRATIAVLDINHPDRIALREELMEEGVFPP